MSLPPTEPLSETLKNLKMNLPLISDKDLIRTLKELMLYWRKAPKRNFLKLYLYKEEMILRLPNLSFRRRIFFKRRFNNCINEINELFKLKKLDESYLKVEVKKIIK